MNMKGDHYVNCIVNMTELCQALVWFCYRAVAQVLSINCIMQNFKIEGGINI